MNSQLLRQKIKNIKNKFRKPQSRKPQSRKPQGRRIWFPEDKNGEPHSKNPDDGCGGAKFKMDNIRYIYKTSDNKLPEEDFSNVLSGSEAWKAHKAEKKSDDFNQTVANYRQLANERKLSKKTKMEIWNVFIV